MTATPDAIVGWDLLLTNRWGAVTGPCTNGGYLTAIDAMLFAATQVGPLRWEPAGDHLFHGFVIEPALRIETITREQYDDAVRCASVIDVRNVAPATVIDPADDPTPDNYGTDTPTPPSAEHAFTELRKGDTVRRCTEPGCNRIHRARGLCDRHYAQAKAAGTLPPLGTAPKLVGERPRVVTPAKDPSRITYGAAAAPARPKPGITAESLGYAPGAPIRWPEDWTTTPDAELGRIVAAALARCSGDKREARKYLGAGQAAFDRALKIARDLGLA